MEINAHFSYYRLKSKKDYRVFNKQSSIKLNFNAQNWEIML
tara:strand:+ start:681 stop:803 length:123 start_codon:yes stop_codon:yes gene_type:complete